MVVAHSKPAQTQTNAFEPNESENAREGREEEEKKYNKFQFA